MAIRVYNTLSRKKEDFETLLPGIASMYVCGPTVYDKAHVGHGMSSLVFDIIRRYLQYRGYEVRHVMNYTDVDDKIIQRALFEEVEAVVLAERYIKEYNEHLKDLNVLPAMIYPRVSTEMPEIIKMVEGLIEKGHAYESEGDVYFRVRSDDDYGKLSRRKLDDMEAGSRIDIDERKEDPMDFAVWKAAKPEEPFWESPWGPGRPGWHIECSSMSLRHLGETIDIHGGGNDLIFPHHENEIAQTECYTGKPFATYWIHNGMLQLTGEKMSKSIGNLVTIEDFLKDHSPNVLRFMVLNSNYRSPLTFNDEVIGQAKKGLERLTNGLRPAFEGVAGADDKTLAALKTQTENTREKFIVLMDDDFNTAGSLGKVFDLTRVINQARDAGATNDELQEAQDLVREIGSVFGLRLERDKKESGDAAPFIDLLIEIRTKLREEKLWELSDLVRDKLKEQGVIIEDSKNGTTWDWE
jgi:cysteinyl-tRNA synthetase